MNYTNYIETLRNNLCHVLTTLRDNEKKIRKIREAAENLEMVQWEGLPMGASMIDRELAMEIEFYETLNIIYGKEANRLVKIILDKPIGV